MGTALHSSWPEVLRPHVEPGIWSHPCGRLSPTPSHYWWPTPWVTDFGTPSTKLYGREVALDPCAEILLSTLNWPSLLLPEMDLPEQPQDIPVGAQLSRADQSGLFTEKNPTPVVEMPPTGGLKDSEEELGRLPGEGRHAQALKDR